MTRIIIILIVIVPLTGCHGKECHDDGYCYRSGVVPGCRCNQGFKGDGVLCQGNCEMMELSRINKVSLVYVSLCSNTGPIRDYSYWISRVNSLELIKLSRMNKVGLL